MQHYDIGADEFDALVERQGGVCASCGRDDPEHVDHHHETGAVRVILCFHGNAVSGSPATPPTRCSPRRRPSTRRTTTSAS
jgi:hypothetical protein